jgi:hypothetical protein
MKTLLASLLLIFSFSSNAGIKTGNDLYKYYRKYKKESDNIPKYVGLYMGYVDGISQSLAAFEAACYPTGVTTRQILDVLGKYLEDNPLERNKSALILTSMVLIRSFPCEEE